jgi:hypothetical protein
MRKECIAASWWWASQLFHSKHNNASDPGKTQEQMKAFQRAMLELLEVSIYVPIRTM